MIGGRQVSLRGSLRGASRRVSDIHRASASVLAAPHSSFVLLLLVVVILDIIGLMMVLSSSSVGAIRQLGSPWVYFDHQLLWLSLGAAAMILTLRMDYRRWRRVGLPLLLVGFGLLVAVLVPGVGLTSGGSSRWVGFGSFRLQPSELMKLAVVVFGAELLSRRADKMGSWADTIRPMVIIFSVAALLILKQPDMGTTLILACIVFGLLFAAGTPVRKMAALLVSVATLALLVGLAEPYRRARLFTFVNPWAHRSGAGYQIVQSLVGLGTGGLLGVGLGASRAKWGFLPNAHTDFIFAIIGEELGLVGSLLVVMLFAFLAYLGIRVAGRAPDRFGGLLAAGITCWVVSQALINIGAVIGVLPVTGVPLPFVSFGGSSLVIIMGAMGILLNIARQERRKAA